MFTTIEQVKEFTGYDVTGETIVRAQAILESVIGKVEAEVSGANDLAILGRATAYQAAYMNSNFEKVYEQVAFTYKGQSDGAITMDRDLMAPFVAPLAVLAIRRLSWVKSRSVKVGTLYGRTAALPWAVD